MKAAQVMTTNPFYLKENDLAQYAALEFRKREIDGAPVLNQQGKMIGIFTKGHLMDIVAQGLEVCVPVRQLMTGNVISASVNATIQEILKTKVGRMPIVDEQGNLQGIVTRTDLLNAYYRETEKSRDKLKAILESTYNAIVAVDKKGIITTWNPAAERITGITKEEALGKSVKDVIPNTGLIDIVRTEQCRYSEKIQLGSITAITNRAPIKKNGQVIGAVAVLQDISDLENIAAELAASKELNKELDAIIDSVYDGLYMTDGQGFTTRINKSYTRITGIKINEVLGRHMQELVDSGYYSQSVTLIVLEKKEPVTIMHTIKGFKKCLITGNPIFNEEGEIIRVVTTVRDITELINLKEKLEKSEELTRRYHEEIEHLRQQQMKNTEVIGQSKEIIDVLELARRAAQVDATILIVGETGVGKEIIAREIHKNSPFKEGPFIKVNCAAIPETLLESELFGYDKGAFTGAHTQGKPGMFELADLGTILLDEIGDIPISLQAKLLRVLQEKEVTRIGGTKAQKLNVRIITATNRDLGMLVKNGSFREDLYYRINVIPIQIPPLRERREDIPLLIKYFLDYFNNKHQQTKHLSLSAVENLTQYCWPGNIRELKNFIERLVVIVNGDIIKKEHLRGLIDKETVENEYTQISREEKLESALAILEKQLILKAWQNYRSTRKAAEALGISQPTVVRKARKYGINLKE